MPITYNKLKGNFIAPEEQSGINDYVDTSVSHPNRAPVVGRTDAREGTVLSYFDDSRGNIQSVGHGGYQTESAQRVEDKNKVEEALDLFESGGSARDFFEIGIGDGLQAKSVAKAGGKTFTEFEEAITAASATDGGGVDLGLETTLSHSYVMHQDSDIQKGELVKLDDNNEIVRADTKEDPAIIGILWMDKTGLDSVKFLDSLNNILPKEERDTKKIVRVASIGDTRNYAYEDNDNYENELLLGCKVCNQNGDIKKGDLLCSSDVPGYLMKQPVQYIVTGFNDKNEPIYESKQVIANITVGKSMEDVTYDSDGKAENVYGYLYCG